MREKKYYLGYYDIDENINKKRNYVLSAVTKMNYILKTINDLDYNLEIISASTTQNKKIYRSENHRLNDKVNLKIFSNFAWGNKLVRLCSLMFIQIQILFYFILFVKKNSQVIVYHSLGYITLVKIIKKIKKIDLILEVEEIYGDVIQNKKIKKKEYSLFKEADKFIFSTELLNEKINIYKKPYTIIYGTYNIENIYNQKFQDNKIHMVYAGTLEITKGSHMALKIGKYLDEKYHIHILGFGSEIEKIALINLIKELSKSTSCLMTYEGTLFGEEYIKFLQKCDIGLCTQNSNTLYSTTSFPSKILSYMTNGLRVVSIKIKSLEKSKLNNLLYYYFEENPEEIAKKIKELNLKDKYNSREEIKKLSKNFKEDIKKLLY
ncbi:hypothetical protein [Cetobacterium sp. SF1]|uniref:hypothetical protein n=1 Tax=Cetobacterium sp. SF1 TaxID=3417654 RepID=UPI003CF8D3C9